MDKQTIIRKVKNALDKLYREKPSLITMGLCERCINHQFAKYLEQEGFNGYFVDCEYNKNYLGDRKQVSSKNGNYIDTIITKRIGGTNQDDLVCFEIKRQKNYSGRGKDRKNLMILTGRIPNGRGNFFAYKFGFYIIFGETREKAKTEIYQKNFAVEKINI